MKAPPLAALLAAVALAFTGCQTPGPSTPLPTAPHVDLRHYCGQWNEIARLPNPWEGVADRALAEYLPMAGPGVRVVNTAVRPDGSRRTIRGIAVPVPGSGNSRLRVKLNGLAALAPVPEQGNYWILAVDPVHYEYALVGAPDRKYLWLLARSPNLDRAIAERLIARAKTLGYATEKLIWDPK